VILSRTPESKLGELKTYKAEMTSRVDEITGSARLLFITDIPGQGMIYSAKEREAVQYLELDPLGTSLIVDPALFPFIFSEVGSTGGSSYEVAQVFINLSHQWRFIGSQLEQMRVGHKAQIGAATSLAAVDQVLVDCELALSGFLSSL